MKDSDLVRKVSNEKLEGFVSAYSYDGEDGTVICLYGDPDGLRSLAQKLEILASVDQTNLSGLPLDEGVHVHLTKASGLQSSHKSKRLDIGRADGKSGNFDWFHRP